MIIVTGASKGIGRAISERIISLGQDVLGLARNPSDAPFPMMACDVADHAQVKRIAQELKRDGRKITGLINAAGIASMNLAVTMPPEVATRIVNTNLLGTIYCCQLLAPLIFRHKAGTIINFSTIAVPIGLKGEAIYVASKAGVEGFSRSFAKELADFNVNVNCIAPGPIETDLLKNVPASIVAKLVSYQIFQRKFTADDVCDLVEMLLDRKSKSLTGQVLYVGGF